MAERLIVFTRYPEPGKSKTRLISALGATAAADLHRQMAEHTLEQVKRLQSRRHLQVEIQFAGGSTELMRAWLGQNWVYMPQSSGDLGDRMVRSLHTAFQTPIDRAIIIGTDCPDLDASLLAQAFEHLNQHDLVLGPATDGGYYLIGLRHFVPELFQNIAWSTATVFQETQAIAHSLNLGVAVLPTLSDVDYPADLPVWHQAKQQASPPQLSIIIPVLNEEHHLPRVLAKLNLLDVEVIVVDGGSHDRTVEVGRSLGAQVISSVPHRAQQMNQGAAIAQSDILLFLHADSRLPEQFDIWIEQTLAQPGVVAGAFELAIDGKERNLRLVEWGVKWRSRLLQLPYGDQAMFLRKSTFQQVGGFPDLPIMEDFVLMRRLRSRGRIAIAPVSVLTSARRWQKLGVLQTTLMNQLVILAYLLGVKPEAIARWYRSDSPKTTQPQNTLPKLDTTGEHLPNLKR